MFYAKSVVRVDDDDDDDFSSTFPHHQGRLKVFYKNNTQE